MAKLSVRHLGQEIASVELAEGMEYFAGRAPESALMLPNEKGISRQHIKFYQRNGVWVAELLSRFGDLILSGKTTKVIELVDNCTFTAAPFEFVFVHHEEPVKPASIGPKEESDELSTEDQTLRLPAVRDNAALSYNQPPLENQMPLPAVDYVPTPPTAYVRIQNKNLNKEQVIKLNGNKWVAGREAGSDILVEDGKASRHHFEITQTSEGFFITDLGSANGTLLNDEELEPNEPWQLAGGDVIQVSKVIITFELQESALVNALVPHAGAQLPYFDPQLMNSIPQQAGWHQPHETAAPPVKKNKVRLALMAIIPLLLYGLFKKDTPAPEATAVNQGELSSTSVTFDSLSPEKKQAVRDSFNLARNMYMQGKYELCLAEIKKLHEIVPAFENSAEFQNHCQQGADLALRQRDKARREQEQAATNRFITEVVNDCRQKFAQKLNLDPLRVCLAPALERDPEHPLVVDLLQTAQIQEEQTQRQQQSLEGIRQRRAAGQRQFERAKSLYKSGALTQALNEYESFLNGNYADLTQERQEAQRDLANVRKELSAKVENFVAQCKSSFDKTQFKEALLACEQALKENPQNSQALSLKSKVVAEMRKELMSIYEDSILEESMGNIDAAKERWKQILEKSVPNEEYYNKAKRGLNKYGGG